MKNYPNQASTLERIRRTLEVVRELKQAGADVDDDGVLGYAAARADAYTFRGFDYEAPNRVERLETRIAVEQAKNPGSQGARTFARELRRTLRDLGWLKTDNSLSVEGDALLETPTGSQEERDALTLGLWGLTAEPGPSHPVRVMLRLLALKESRGRDGLELALEAADDSDAEFSRVAVLYGLPSAERHEKLAEAGITDFQIANAKKIFPSLARAAGLVIEDPPQVYRLSDVGRGLIDAPDVEAVLPSRQAAVRKALRSVSPETIGATLGAGTSRTLTPEEQLAARQVLSQRTTRHNQTVKRLAKLFVDGGTFQEGSVDLLWDPPSNEDPFVLVEVKTVETDGDAQVRQAYGQLAFYEYFDVRPIAGGRSVLLAVATDNDVSDNLGGYLDDLGVALISVPEVGWKAMNATAEALRPFLASTPGAPEPA